MRSVRMARRPIAPARWLAMRASSAPGLSLSRSSPKTARRGDAAANVNTYGTTLRVFDPRIDAWQVQWSDPVTQNFLHMIGRAQGDDIVQLGTRADGHLIRWTFLEITPDSFLWRGEISADAGASWRVVTEFRATRIA
jgi:hypothetical protein